MRIFHNTLVRPSYTANRLARQRAQWRLIKFASVFLLATGLAGLATVYSTPVPTPTTIPAKAVSVTIPSCSRSNYTQPAALSVSPAQPGLHTTVLPPAYYTVYGDTPAQIYSQMAACSPVHMANGDFAAATSYAIDWTYNYQNNADGTCSLSDASVGVAVSQVFPAWQQTAGAAPGLAAGWQQFINGLHIHEAYFAQSDPAGAANLLSDLQNFPATDCSSIAAAANAKAHTDLAGLNQANTSYDAGTGYGATQGAVLK